MVSLIGNLIDIGKMSRTMSLRAVSINSLPLNTEGRDMRARAPLLQLIFRGGFFSVGLN